MTMSTAQEVGFGAFAGGMSAILTNLGLRYWSDNTVTVPKDTTEQPSRPFLYEHAPLLGIVPGAVAAFASYKWLGGAPAAVACAITALFASTAPPINDWIIDARNEKDATKDQTTTGTSKAAGYAARVAAMGRAA